MNTYFIHESNLERLEKKINAIKKKCNKNNSTFYYEQTGVEQFRKLEPDDGPAYIARFVEVKVFGQLKYEGWKFAATIEHHDACNVVRSFDDELVIPDKYKTCGPECEHCNRIRSRKDTYLIVNEEGQFKQVGKSCLKEYTHGLDAEEVTSYIALFNEMIKGESYSGSGYRKFLEVEEVVRYAFECTYHFGYEKSSYDEWEEPKRTTKSRVSDYMDVRSGATGHYTRAWIDQMQSEMDSVNFNPDSERAVSDTKAALEWIRSEKVDSNQYINNLKGVCSEDYVEGRDLGLLVSLPIAYLRHLEKVAAYQKKEKLRKEESEASQYVGEVGQRLTISLSSFACVSSFETMYGTTWLYKMTDNAGNVYTWFASNPVPDDDKVTSIVGTVKKHEEYNGVRQTILTRCKASA